MRREITVTVNGKPETREVETSQLLVEFLRDTLQLTGTHVGCDTSQCGSCTVIVDGKAAKSCTILTAQADGSSVTTIEGLAKNGELHPVQRAFQSEHAAQCGYCTPGMILTAVDLLARNASPSDAEIRHAIEGNLCRCTGYQNIVTAIGSAAKESRAAAKAAPRTAEVSR